MKCIDYKSIFIGFIKCSRAILLYTHYNNHNIHDKKCYFKIFKCKNEKPRLTLAKIIIIFQGNVITLIKLDYSNKYLIFEELRNRQWSCEEKDVQQRRRRIRRNSGTTSETKNVKNGSKFNLLNVKQPCKSYNISHRKICLSGDIELNPGPPNSSAPACSKLKIMTYNVQGIGGLSKVKRVTNIFNKLEHRESYVINLQETHFKNVQTLQYHWKWGNTQSLGSSSSCGVAILYSKSFFDEIIETRSDNDGRYCSITLSKDEDLYTFVNVYAPNNHYDSLEFMSYLESEIDDIFLKYPLTNLVCCGDYNVVMNHCNDSIGRSQSKQEKMVLSKINEINSKHNLIDSYRKLNQFGGFTWGKNNPTFLRSRLDYIFVSESLIDKLTSSYVTYTYNESDHNPVTSEFSLDYIKNGPGIVRANSTLLDKPEIRDRIKNELEIIIEEMPTNWNPHQILDYFKYSLRALLLREGRKKAVTDKTRLEQADLEIGRLKAQLDVKLSTRKMQPNSISSKLNGEIEALKEAIKISEFSTKDIRDEESKRLIFRSRAKWSELGEKSNKYFLNLIKDRQRKMQIRKITSCGKTFVKQDEISKAIGNFYANLYKKQPDLKKVDISDNVFKSLPTLSEADSNMLKSNLALDELYSTLKTCNESAPGPDGISYDAYRHLWSLAGPIVLKAWDYSNKIGITSASQRESIITLLDKNGKDRTKIENLRPISLSNCDIKLCTKALALRTSKVINKLVDRNQSGYVPGRQVTDNIRLLEEIIDYANDRNEESFLITLDAQKAFDSVDHDYLLEILKVYKFPKEYINWIKILYTDLNASVLVNGYTTFKFKIQQSVKQGNIFSITK